MRNAVNHWIEMHMRADDQIDSPRAESKRTNAEAQFGVGHQVCLMNVPLCNSLIACRSCSCVFITMGPCHATGSWIGAVDMPNTVAAEIRFPLLGSVALRFAG